MLETITLPASLRRRIAAIRRRARFLRAMRGFGLLVLLLGLSAGTVLLADYWLDLSPLARQALFAAWISEGVGLLLGSILMPLCRRIDTQALAAVIEQKYPDLGERLTSAVELAETHGEGHGSPVLIALLMDETENQSRRLDFRPAVPARRAGLLAALAAVVVLLGIAPAFVWPREYADLTQRFFRPWRVAHAVTPYTLEVTPGDAIAGRGRSVILSAHLVPTNEQATLPDSATLVAVDANGKEAQQTMERNGTSEFTFEYKVPGDVSYRIEAGEVVSDTYHLTAVTPVELATESPRVTVTPPAYARATKDEETFHGLVDLAPLQHSEVRFDFRFTRPAVAANLEWITENKSAKNGMPLFVSNTATHPLTLSDDRQSAAFTMPATVPGKYHVVLEAEYGIRTVLQGGMITVRPDQPPAVLKFAGKEGLHAALPSQRVPLGIEVTDDVAVASVELEYRINDDEAVRQPLDLQGGNTPSAVGRHRLDLTGKVKEDDRVYYRFRITDNLPKEYKGPNVIVYPADRWLTLQVARRGDPLKQQEILAQRDEINRKLDTIKEAVLKEKRGVYKVQQETHNQASVQPEQAEQIKDLQHNNRDSQTALRDVAQMANVTPALHPIANLARDVADSEMHETQQALDQVPSQPSPRDRTRQFDKADKQLASAAKRLDELKKVNERVAQERLDQVKLETLAEREKQLTEKVAELAAKHPVLDPSVKEQAEKIKRQQAEVAAGLERLTLQSEPLKRALEQARGEEARQMAERARDLAKAERELARASEETEKNRMADLARQQQGLAEQAAKLARETRQPAQAMQTQPLKPEEAQRAADALKQGDPQEAVKHQEQAARDLERLAEAFDRAHRISTDPREAARRLAQTEKALRQRVQEEMEKRNAKQPLAERLKPLQEEQNAIRRAAERLSVPPGNPDSQKAKQQISERAAQAAESIQKNDASRAKAQMEETRKLLNRLADSLPNLEQRRQQAQNEVSRLRRQQDEIARSMEQIKKDDPKTARRWAEAARRQAEVAEALSKMDAPNQEGRQERTAEALNRALADLLDRRPEDAPASQREAQRQLERLEQALRGQKPADEQARDLARQQRALARAADRVAADPKPSPSQQRDLQRKQQQLAEQIQKLQAPEAPQRQREAAEAVRQAAEAAKTQPTASPTRERMREAARKLDELARQMAGEEKDVARAERLANRQAEEAARAQREPDKAAMPEAQRLAREIAHEAREIRGGDEARQEKQRAMEALAHAREAPAKDQARAQRQAADALRDWADRLAGRAQAAQKPTEQPGRTTSAKPADQSPRQMAQQMAQQQRELAKAAQQAQQGGKAAMQRAMQRLAAQQRQLNQQASQLPSNQAQRALEQARTPMNQAEQALANNDAARAQQKQTEAANALERLAEQLPAQTPQATKHDPQEAAGATPRGLPSKEQSDEARQLARQQRELRDVVQRVREAARAERPIGRDNPVGDLARQQAEVAEQAAELARNVNAEQGKESAVSQRAEQVRDSAQQAARQMQAGALPGAQEAGKQAAEQLQQLAAQLARTPSGTDPQASNPLQQARQLGRRQEEINRQMEPLTEDAHAQAAQQQAQQKNLQQQDGELMQELNRLAQQPMKSPQVQSSLRRALGASQDAWQAMQQARSQAQQGHDGSARQLQEQAARSLDQAAREASQAASQEEASRPGSQPQQTSSAQSGLPKPGSGHDSQEGSRPAGQTVQQARQQMARAQRALGKGQPDQARAAMRQATHSLEQAAQQMAANQEQPGQSGQQPAQSPRQGRAAGGAPDLSTFGLDKTPYAGKSWGELPGELRTKIVQDMKGRYGEDYARMIKLYFEQIASTDSPTNRAPPRASGPQGK